MAKFTPERQAQIMRRMVASTVANTDLSDVGDASVTKRVLKSAARSDAEQNFQMSNLRDLFNIEKAFGDDLDERAAEFNGMLRIGATKAAGFATFARVGTSGTTPIPIGTRIKTSTGIGFVTTSAGSITNGNSTSSPVPILALVEGISGNVAAATVIKFDNKPAGVTTVTNASATTGGTDKESDDAFKARIRKYTASLARCPEQAIEAALTGLTDPVSGKQIRSVNVVTDSFNRGTFYVYIDDGNGTAETTQVVVGEVLITAVGGETFKDAALKPIKVGPAVSVSSSTRGALTEGVTFTLDRSRSKFKFTPALTAGEVITIGYTANTGLIAYAQKVVYGDKNDRTNFPGYAAAGTWAIVLTPQILIQTIAAAVVALDGYVVGDVRLAVRDAIVSYINNLGISGDVLFSNLVAVAKNVSGVFNIKFTTPTPDADGIILDDQLARTISGNVTIT